MKRLSWFFLLLLLLAMAPVAWAGPAEEIDQVRKQRIQAFHEGNLEAFMATYADNAVLTPSLSPFRIEGKEAIRDTIAGLFQAFPTRKGVLRQYSIRVYGDTTGVVNAYEAVTYVDRDGKVTTHYLRESWTYVKLGDRWLVVDHHVSRLPASP